jgi:hypothetical protein
MKIISELEWCINVSWLKRTREVKILFFAKKYLNNNNFFFFIIKVLFENKKKD